MRLLAALLIAVLMTPVSAPVAWAKDKKPSKGSLEEKQEKRLAELDGTEWEINVLPREAKAKPFTDKIVFRNGKIDIKMFNQKGFGPAGYTLTAFEENDMGRWETYQTLKDGAESLSARGDWNGERMDGVISASFDKGKKIETYNFSTSKKSLLPPDEAASTASAPAASEGGAPAKSSGGVLVSKESSSKR